MSNLSVDDVVELALDIPQQNLHRGMKGIVRSLWFAPTLAYEVEFTGLDECTRAVLMREQVTTSADAMLAAPETGRFDETSMGAW